jgi:hypothetical protein
MPHRGRRPEWVRDAEEEYPDVNFYLGDCENCPERRCHHSPIAFSIDEAIDYAQDIPVLWWIESPDNGNSFDVVICDESGGKTPLQPTEPGRNDELERDDDDSGE